MTDLGALIAEFLSDAESSGLYDHDQLRALRANLAHVIASDLGSTRPDAIRGRQIDALMAELRADGVAAGRVEAIVAGLRLVFAYAVGRGLIKSSPLVGPRGRGRPRPVTHDRDAGTGPAGRRLDRPGHRDRVRADGRRARHCPGVS